MMDINLTKTYKYEPLLQVTDDLYKSGLRPQCMALQTSEIMVALISHTEEYSAENGLGQLHSTGKLCVGGAVDILHIIWSELK